MAKNQTITFCDECGNITKIMSEILSTVYPMKAIKDFSVYEDLILKEESQNLILFH